MARTFTLGTLVTRCQQRCDLENDDHIGTSEWKGLLSTALAELHSILVASGMRYFESVQSISSGSLSDDGGGGGSVALPADFLSSVGVDRQDGTLWLELDMLMAQERNVLTGFTGSFAVAWATIGANLHLYPKPPSGQTYRHIYAPQPPDVSSSADGTSIDVVTPDGEAFVVEYVAVRALAKEESDPTLAINERERARARVERWASLRALQTPRRRVGRHGPFFDAADDPASWRLR